MASIKLIVSDNFRAELIDGRWAVRATTKIAKQLFKIKSIKNGDWLASGDYRSAGDSLDAFEGSVFKLAEISGDA